MYSIQHTHHIYLTSFQCNQQAKTYLCSNVMARLENCNELKKQAKKLNVAGT